MLALLALVAVLAAACGGGGGGDGATAGLPGSGKTIEVWDGQWETLDVNNAIAGFILRHGYGYKVEQVVLGTSVMEQALPQGDVDVALETWHVNRIEWYEKVTGDGSMKDLGPIFDEATQGYYVPRYVVEGDEQRGIKPVAPELKSVSDLPKYKQVFADPEDRGKGAVISCPPEWSCHPIDQVKFAAYGLLDDYNLKNPGSPGALDAEIVGAIERGEPVVAYYWEPTAIVGRYDMLKLDEPEWTEECWAAVEAAKDSPNPRSAPPAAGCAYRSHPVNKGIHADLARRAPEAVSFLERMEVGTDALNKVTGWMNENKAEADKGAIWFFENFDHWRDWVDGEVLDRVEEALRRAGADLS